MEPLPIFTAMVVTIIAINGAEGGCSHYLRREMIFRIRQLASRLFGRPAVFDVSVGHGEQNDCAVVIMDADAHTAPTVII